MQIFTGMQLETGINACIFSVSSGRQRVPVLQTLLPPVRGPLWRIKRVPRSAPEKVTCAARPGCHSLSHHLYLLLDPFPFGLAVTLHRYRHCEHITIGRVFCNRAARESTILISTPASALTPATSSQ
jgi:hypothetical protein